MKRIIETLRKKWPEYLLEILVIVIGIYGAFAVDNWKEDRQMTKQEQSILKDLLAEYEDTKIKIEETLKKQERTVRYSVIMIDVYNQEGEDFDFSGDSIGNLLGRGPLSYWRIEPVMGTYESVLGSGSLEAIQNSQLKRKMADFHSEVIQGFEDHDLSILNNNELTIRTPSYWLSTQYLKHVGLTKLPDASNILKLRKKNFYDFIHDDIYFGIVLIRAALEVNRLQWQKSLLQKVDGIISMLNENIETN